MNNPQISNAAALLGRIFMSAIFITAGYGKIGFQTRIVAFLLAGFTLLAGLMFHYAVGDGPNMIHFWKNVAIAGGFLGMVAHGAGAWSIDGRMKG